MTRLAPCSCVLLVALAAACGGDDGAADAATHDAAADAFADASVDALDADDPLSLEARVDAPTYADVDALVRFDASASDAARYTFELGDGRVFGPTNAATLEVRFERPGRVGWRILVERGEERASARGLLTVTLPRTHTPSESGTLAREGARGAAVYPDANLVTRFEVAGDRLHLVDRVATPAGPRTVALSRGLMAVACQDAAVLLVVRGDERVEVALPAASRPFGVVGVPDGEGTSFWVTLQALGELAEVRVDAEGARLVRRIDALADPRGVAVAPSGELVVTRWRSPDERGELLFVDAATGARRVAPLAFDPRESHDTEHGGVPSYLHQALFSPTGRELAVPSLQANLVEGVFRDGRPLTFETTVRAVVSYLEPDDEGAFVERFVRRKHFDNRGLAAAGVYSSRGDYLYLAMRGHRSVERMDVLTRTQAGAILGTGHAPDGLALFDDDRRLVVNASLDGRLELYDTVDWSTPPRALDVLPLLGEGDATTLSEVELEGKRLFNDTFDVRVARDGYVACAHCHLDGDSDHRVWDFTGRGEGLRRTPPLFGRMDHGLFHWSANFDEVQDFENDIRAHQGGRGLMRDDDFARTADTLGPPKAGLSAELDALTAYVATLVEPPSPHRAADGSLPEEAARGRAHFVALACASCHAGDVLTDSGLDAEGRPVLHDVGTLREGSGARLGEPLTGIDTPTLHGLWHQPRYLHDGHATSLEDVLLAHGGADALTPAERADLVAYLRCLDGRVD
ncbi:MAG: hypothetical protein KF901_17485 [Myxococcales bacterium]|nr:hypothetical protein [Myxococcales bacterium]